MQLSVSSRSVLLLALSLAELLLVSLTVTCCAGNGDAAAIENRSPASRQFERLGRGPVALLRESGVFLSWRLLRTDPDSIAFDIYRDGLKINQSPVTGSTNYVDAEGKPSAMYSIVPLVDGKELAKESTPVWGQPFHRVPLQRPDAAKTPDGREYSYSPNDTSVGDLDGDGEYELIVKWEPSNAQNNSRAGYTGKVFLDAYKLDGTLLWRIDLGWNVRAGAHYTQFLVYDFYGDGKGLYSTGHGDALHLGDLDPARPGLEVFMVHETPGQYGQHGVEMRAAEDGRILWSISGEGRDVGRGVAIDLDPRYPGTECWGSRGGLMSAAGEIIATRKPRQTNFAVWWDGDLLREILDRETVSKWDPETGRSHPLLTASDFGARSNNGTKATPALSADILGDWREGVILRHRDNDALLIFTTTIPTQHRLPTLMHDPQYRVSIAWQNVGYNQPPHPGFHLGPGMK